MSPLKAPTNKASSIGVISAMGTDVSSKQGFRQAMHYADTAQMGGLKNSMQPNLNHRLPSSHQKMESGDTQYSSIRNGARNIVSSKRNVLATELPDAELQQVPIKIFEMHGFVRAPMKVEEMQGTTIYRGDQDYHGTMGMNPRQTSSKRQK